MSVFEESAFYEIVELENGEIALQKSSDKNDEPLVKVVFSPESNEYLGDARFEVAKAMIEAGLDAVADMESEDDIETVVIQSNLLH